jgi:hypothetical protein
MLPLANMIIWMTDSPAMLSDRTWKWPLDRNVGLLDKEENLLEYRSTSP